MKVEVSEATGPVLDWMVAKAEGYLDAEMTYPNGSTTMVVVTDEFGRPFDMRFGVAWRPSEKWRQGGPIIEREFIELYWHAALECWAAKCNDNLRYGTTPLLAAMRGYVASKLGDEVEVPEELI